MTIVTPPPEINRDRYGRPLIIPPEGGKPVAYTRCTTYIDVLEDKFNLQKWMQRMVALGLASRPDLMLSISAHRDNKRELDAICEKAREAASASAAATTGTALHALTELIDRGLELPAGLPANARASLDAYVEATADLKATHIEQFCVLDTIKVGGTPDRVVSYGGERYIADLKTGSIEWGALKMSMQLGIYSRAKLYDIVTGERSLHGANTSRGIIIHLPAVEDPAEARCELHWIDIEEGWYAVQVAGQVREKRRLRFNDLTKPFGPVPAIAPGSVRGNTAIKREKAVEATSLAGQVNAAASAEEIRDLWAAHQGEWNQALTDLAARKVAELDGNPAA